MTRPEESDRETPDDTPGSSPGAAGAPPPAAPPVGPAEECSGTIAALTADDLDQSERRRLLGRLAGQIRARGIADLFRPRAAMRWVADAVSDIAPRLPIREAQTLRRHHPYLTDDALAERLIRNAARTTAAVGAASGGVAAGQEGGTPTPPSGPARPAGGAAAAGARQPT